VQTKGDAQTVGPVKPVPPHCPYSVCVGPTAVEVEVVEVEDFAVEVEDFAEVDAVVVPLDELELTGGGTDPVPFPTLVVIGPLSTYTPEKYQSSGVPPFTIRRTPRCQSSELVDAEVAMFCTTLTNGFEPVLAHSPTVCPVKSIS